MQPWMLRCCRVALAASGVGAGEACSSTSSSSSSVPKRFNYADADRVRASSHLSETSSSSMDSIASEYMQIHPRAPPSLRSSSPREWLAVWMQRMMLRGLRLRRVGWVLAKVLEMMAYAGYIGVGGRIRLYQRHALVGEPLAQTPSSSSSSTSSSSPSHHFRGLLHENALHCLYVGQSNIHGRGLFTSVDLPRGTRILHDHHRTCIAAPSFLRLLADTHQQLPDTYHYTLPRGALLEMILQAQPQHMINHSCAANVCSGLSPMWWSCALHVAERMSMQEATTTLSSSPPSSSCASALVERMALWPSFYEANSFFTMRDVCAGEELTMSYARRVAPMYAGEVFTSSQNIFLCHCGQPTCTQYALRPPSELRSYCADVMRASSSSSSSLKQRYSLGEVAGELMCRFGVDDEWALMSLLPSSRPMEAYLDSSPQHVMELLAIPASKQQQQQQHSSSSCSSPLAAQLEMARRRLSQLPASSTLTPQMRSKRDILMSYRHVFALLNHTAPTRG